MIQQTPQKRVTFKRTLRTLTLGVFGIATILYGGFALHPQETYAATSSTVNFQARLEGAGGSIAPDGLYNIQFNMYDVSSGGSALWTESYYDANGVTAGQDNRVQVTNGYVSVALGSQTALSGVNWNQNTWITMNIGGTTQTATPTYDGEMAPRLALTAVPYAFQAGQLATGNGTLTSTLSLIQPTVGNQIFQVPDQAAAGTYTLCVQGSTSGCTAASGSGFYIQNQNAGVQTTSNFWISGTGRADTSLLTPLLDTASGALNIGTSTATTITIGRTTQLVSMPGSLQLGGTTTVNGVKLNVNGAIEWTSTGSHYGIQSAVDFNPQGASLTNIYGVASVANVSGSSIAIGNLYGGSFGVSTGALYTGLISSATGLNVSGPAIAGSQLFSSYRGIDVGVNSANGGNTSGIINNSQIITRGVTAGAAGSGTVNNYAINITQPAGSGGTATNNYGLYIQGNGAGTANYSIYNGSTAASYFTGDIRVATLTNTNGYALNLVGTAAASTGVLTPLVDVATAGTLSLGTGTATTIAVGGTNTTNLDIGTTANNKTITIGSSGAVNNTTAINIGNTIAAGGANTIQIGGTGSITGSNTATTITLQSGPAVLLMSNAGVDVFSHTAQTTAFQVQSGVTGSSALVVDTTPLNALVSNGSFELGLNGWTAAGTGASLGQTNGEMYIGGASMQFTTGTAVGNSARLVVGTAFSTSSTYTMSFYAKATGGMVNALSGSYSPDGTAANETDCAVFTPSRTVSSFGWTRYTCTINTSTVSPTASGYVAIKQIDTSSRTLYIDGVQIEAGGAISDGLIANTGLEAASTWVYVGTPGSAVQSAAAQYNGTKSLLITTTANPLNGAKLVTNNTGTTQLLASTTYSLSFMAKSSGTALTTMVAGYARDGATDVQCALNSGTLSNSAWNAYSCTFTTDSTAPAATAYIYIKNSANTVRAWYVDDVQLTKLSSVASPAAYQDSGISLNGVVTSPTSFHNRTDSTTAFQIQNAAGVSLLNADTLNNKINITALNVGSNGTSTGQLYNGGQIPTTTVGSLSTGATGPVYLAVQNHIAYTVNTTTNQLISYDVTNPSAPTTLVSATTGTAPSRVFVLGNYAYVVNDTTPVLQIFDISINSSITSVGSVSIGTNPRGLYVQGRYAYVVNTTSNNLQIIDVGNPTAPVVVGTQAGLTGAQSVYVQGRYAYVTSFTAATLSLIDVSNPAAPFSFGSVSTTGGPSGLAVQGRYAYVGNATNLQIYRMTSGSTPVLQSTLNIGSSIGRIVAQGRYIYLYTSGSPSLMIIDVADPAAPAIVGTVNNGGFIASLAVQGRYAYTVSTTANTLQVYDLGGAYIQQLEVGGLDVGTISTSGNVAIGNDTTIGGGLQVAKGVDINGGLGVTGSANFISETNSATAFQIQNAAGSAALTVDTTALNALVSNSSFEIGTTGWSASGTGASIARNTTEKFVGSASLAFTTGTAVGNSARLVVGTAFNTATTYTLSFYVKAGTAMSTLSASYSPDGTAANETDCALFSPSRSVVTTGWTRYNCTINTSSVADTAAGYIAIKQSDATSRVLYIDGVQIEAQASIFTGLIANTGIEAASAWTYVGTPGSAVQSAADKYNGTNSLLITTTANANNGAKLVTGNAGATALSTGLTYTLSFWAKSTGTALTTMKAAYARDGATEVECVLNSSTLSASAWNFYSCNIATDATSPAAGAYITIINTGATVRTWYIDDVQITKSSSVVAPTVFRESAISLSGAINSSVSIRNQADSTTAFQIQNAAGSNLFTADTLNGTITIGSLGTPTGQLYLSGSNPTLTAIASVSSSPVSLVVQGRYMYSVSSTSAVLEITDVSNPTSPKLLGSVAISGTPNLLTVVGRYAYVVTSTSFQIIDVTNAASPVSVSTTATGGSTLGIYVQGRYAYVANNGSGLFMTYDISNPATPVLVASVSLAGATRIVVQGHYAYVTSFSGNSLNIYDIANPASPALASSYNLGTSPRDVAVQGRYAYLLNHTSGMLNILDVSNPSVITAVSNVYVITGAFSISLQGRYAYIVSPASNVLKVVDISNPLTATVVSTTAATGPASIFVQGRYAYVSDNTFGFIRIFDVGGAYLQQLEAGGIEAGNLSSANGLAVGTNATVGGGLQVGGGAQIAGSLGVTGSANFISDTNAVNAFKIQSASNDTVLGVDTTRTTNLLTNPGFENGVTGWSAAGGAGSPTQTTTVTNTNFGIAAMTYTTTAASQGFTTSSFTSTVPAGIYIVSFYMMTNTNQTTANTLVNLNDGSSHTCVPTMYGTTSSFFSNTDYRRAYCVITTVANLSSLTVTQTDATARTNYIDGVQLEANNSTGAPTAYRIAGLALRGVVTTPLVIQAAASTSNAFQVLGGPLNGTSVFRVDSVNAFVMIGTDQYTQSSVQFTTNSQVLAAGSSTLTVGTGLSGTLNLGNTNTATINIGGASLATTTIGGGNVAHQIDIGSAATSTAQLITIGANTITNGSRLILNGSVATTSSGNSGVIIGSATADVSQVDLQLDTSSVFAETASTCTTTVNQGALYYNSSSNAVRTCVAGGWEDVMTTAGLGLIMFGIVPDSGTTPGDMAGVNATDANDGPCKVYMGSVANSVRWTGCTLYAYGRKHIITAQAANYTTAITTTANAFQNLCIAAPGAQPTFLTASATESSTTMMTTPGNWSISSPSICLATIKEIAGGSGIGSIYDTRVFTTSTKAAVSVNTLSNIGFAVRPSATVGVLAPVNATTDPFIGVLASYSGSISATAINGIAVVNGQTYVKATTATVNQYVIPTATAGYTSGSALVVAARTDIPYNLLGIALTTANAPGTQCSVTANADTCRGSVLVNINIR